MQLENNNPAYFADLLPAKEHWRLFNEFRESTAYIDIETMGIKLYGFEITTIALYDGKNIFARHKLTQDIQLIQVCWDLSNETTYPLADCPGQGISFQFNEFARTA